MLNYWKIRLMQILSLKNLLIRMNKVSSIQEGKGKILLTEKRPNIYKY